MLTGDVTVGESTTIPVIAVETNRLTIVSDTGEPDRTEASRLRA
jgi:ribosomal protein L30E